MASSCDAIFISYSRIKTGITKRTKKLIITNKASDYYKIKTALYLFFITFVKTLKMKKIIAALLVLLTFQISAQVKPAAKGVTYGSALNSSGAITVDALNKQLQNNKDFTGKVQGTVVSVCTAEGCWMKLKRTSGDDVMIKFKSHSFFVPKNILGKEVVLNGEAKVTTTSVEMLQHYAEDAGKTKQEIKKITKPKTEIEFVADGVLVI